MPDPADTDWKAIVPGLRVRPGEAELRRLDAVQPPGVARPVRVLRALGWLREIDRERAAALAALRTRTTLPEPALIDEMLAARLPDVLFELQNQTWCPGDAEQEAVRVLVAGLTVGTDDQVRRLVADGVLHVLKKAPDSAAVPAVARVLAVGATDAGGAGRNPFADQLRALGWADRLADVRRRHQPPAPTPEPPRGWFGRFRPASPVPAPAPGGLAAEADRLAAYFAPPGPADVFAADGSDRALGWRYLYPLVKHRRFPRWDRGEAAAAVVEEACPLVVKLFVSHRWATPTDPDPGCDHLRTVVEYLSWVYMVANGQLAADSVVVRNVVIGDGLRDAFHASRLDRCRCGSEGWVDVRGLLDPGALFLTRVDDIHSRRNFYRLLKHLRVWYDYSSLPQSRGAADDDAFLDRALARLAEVVGGAEVLTLWGLESLSRAWCVFEALAAGTVHVCSPAYHADRNMMTDAMILMAGRENPRKAEEMVAHRAGPSLNVMVTVNQIRAELAGLGVAEVRDYLVKRKIECTKPSDLDRLAGLIHGYLKTDSRAKPG